MTQTASERELLRSGLAELSVKDPEEAASRLLDFGRLVLSENRKTNLTGAHSLLELIAKHVLDSLAPLAGAQPKGPIVDLGSGAGFPGIPVAIAYPGERVVLIEPRAKRAAFLQSAVGVLSLKNAQVIQSSAAGPKAEVWLARAETVLIRAVAPPRTAMRLGLPFVRPGGALFLYQGRASRPRPQDVTTARGLGASDIVTIRVRVPKLKAERHAWIMRKAKGGPRRGGGCRS